MNCCLYYRDVHIIIIEVSPYCRGVRIIIRDIRKERFKTMLAFDMLCELLPSGRGVLPYISHIGRLVPNSWQPAELTGYLVRFCWLLLRFFFKTNDFVPLPEQMWLYGSFRIAFAVALE